MQEEPVIQRPVARVLLIDASERLLLFDTQLAYGRFWLAPGGALLPGETPEQAAVRELHEETGIEGARLGPCVWTYRFQFRYEGRLYDQHERYYVVRVAAVEVDDSLWEVTERLEILAFRWWTPAEIEASGEVFRPPNLAQLLPA